MPRVKRFVMFAGTRPEIIKLVPVRDALRLQRAHVDLIVIGQQPDLLQDTGAVVTLAIPRDDGTLAELHTGIITALQSFPFWEYDAVLVQGDTATAFAAAYAAHLVRSPIAHVEAGLRTHARNPWPEEANRRLIAALADWHFTTTPLARANLIAEGVPGDTIHYVGSTGIDALHTVLAQVPPLFVTSLNTDRVGAVVPDWPWRVLVTCHRRENVDRIPQITDAIARLAPEAFEVIWPRHPNYAGDALDAYQRAAAMSHVHGVDPLPPATLAHLLQGVDLVITDSGGVIEEATELDQPCLILRDETERPEALDEACVLVSHEQMTSLTDLVERYVGRPRSSCGRFGDGQAAARIADVLTRPASG